jgi:hypothetical protein
MAAFHPNWHSQRQLQPIKFAKILQGSEVQWRHSFDVDATWILATAWRIDNRSRGRDVIEMGNYNGLYMIGAWIQDRCTIPNVYMR